MARDIELASESDEVSYEVLALDARTGKVVWQREAHRGKPSGGRHRKNTYASETPATDGERVYASFGGNVGLFCYSREGTLLWKQSWTPQPIYLDFGTASSPVVHDGRVYQLHDNEGESFLVALEARTGTIAWKVSRTANEGRLKSGWATPFVWQNELRTEIVTVGRGLVISYDKEGHELWRLKGITQATPTPVAGEGLLFVGSGSQGENSRPLFAIRPGAAGDISTAEGAPRSEFVSWFLPRFSAYTGSPLLYRGRLYAVNDNGILQVADARTGKESLQGARGGRRHHLLELAPRQRRAHLPAERGRRDVRAGGGRRVQGAREEQPGRDEPGQSRSRRRRLVPANPDEAVPGAGPGAFEAVS